MLVIPEIKEKGLWMRREKEGEVDGRISRIRTTCM